ncbi:hypothetical protein F4809DRAFT_268295 [Biscogniauxia mediterranea]|nr:hypothetical protein F4809DRAFT_268295 [Biscogniauxia mediterranea]
MLTKSSAYGLALLAAFQAANAHSWVETLYRIDSTGAFTGDAGYPIGYLPRGAGVSDDAHQNKILDTKSNPAICKPKSSSNYQSYPRLTAAAGDYAAMQYQENGHVTQPELTQRPYRGGNVYVYGTLEHQDSDGISDVLNSWTADGTGGNGKGKLLASHYFDDGQCYQQVANNPINSERTAKYGLPELWCQSDFQLPEDLPSEGTYTVMWVWDWPLIVSDTQNVTEIYTSCAEIELGGAKEDTTQKIKFASNNKVQSAGISSQLAKLIEATALGVGTSSPPAPTGLNTGDATPTTTSAPAESTSPKKGKGGIQTVTVTAAPETVTQLTTVTLGASDANAQPSATATATSAPNRTESHAEKSVPTTLVPVTQIEHFMMARARMTGQARREAIQQRR